MACPFSSNFLLTTNGQRSSNTSKRGSTDAATCGGSSSGGGSPLTFSEEDDLNKKIQSRQSSIHGHSSSPATTAIFVENAGAEQGDNFNPTLNLKCLSIAIQLLTNPPVSTGSYTYI